MAIKSQFADFLKSYMATAGSSTVEVYFPFTDGYRLMGLSAYLRYKGFRLAGQGVVGSEATPAVVVEGRAAFVNNRCVEYRDYACTHADSAPDGALIVVLPDDKASMADVEEIGKDSVLLFSTETCAVCTRPGSWLRLLHAISISFPDNELPANWLHLHVFSKSHASAFSRTRAPAGEPVTASSLAQ
jgi:hypothetical protein